MVREEGLQLNTAVDSTHLALHSDGVSTIPVEDKTEVLLGKTIEEEAVVGAQRLR